MKSEWERERERERERVKITNKLFKHQLSQVWHELVSNTGRLRQVTNKQTKTGIQEAERDRDKQKKSYEEFDKVSAPKCLKHLGRVAFFTCSMLRPVHH